MNMLKEMQQKLTAAMLAREVDQEEAHLIRNSIAFVKKHGDVPHVVKAINMLQNGASLPEWTRLCIEARDWSEGQ